MAENSKAEQGEVNDRNKTSYKRLSSIGVGPARAARSVSAAFFFFADDFCVRDYFSFLASFCAHSVFV
jgi:hypothetical protein